MDSQSVGAKEPELSMKVRADKTIHPQRWVQDGHPMSSHASLFVSKVPAARNEVLLQSPQDKAHESEDSSSDVVLVSNTVMAPVW